MMKRPRSLWESTRSPTSLWSADPSSCTVALTNWERTMYSKQQSPQRLVPLPLVSWRLYQTFNNKVLHAGLYYSFPSPINKAPVHAALVHEGEVRKQLLPPQVRIRAAAVHSLGIWRVFLRRWYLPSKGQVYREETAIPPSLNEPEANGDVLLPELTELAVGKIFVRITN